MEYETDPTVVEIEVTVGTIRDGSVIITCNPNPVPVSVPNSLLVFNLRTPGYHFKGTGAIVIDGTFEDFPYPSWTLNAKTSALFDACNQADQFEYSVFVKRDKDGVEFSVDPIIDNGMGCKP
jgi:hypothetical protein